MERSEETVTVEEVGTEEEEVEAGSFGFIFDSITSFVVISGFDDDFVMDRVVRDGEE